MRREIDRAPLIGEFNTNYFVRGTNPQNEVLLRIPRQNRDMMANLIDEYLQIGFTGRGGRVRRRSPEEQYQFGRAAATAGLRVLPPLTMEGKYSSYAFLKDAVPLDTFFKLHPDEIDRTTLTLVDDLKKAHQAGFTYGDRWSGNILVVPQLGLTHIDFDLEISGPPARELDVAQVAYHTLWASEGKAQHLLAQLLSGQNAWFNVEMMTKFMRGLARFLKDTKVGGMEEAVEEFISVTRSHSNGYTK